MTPIKCNFCQGRSDHRVNGTAAATLATVIDLRSDTVTTPTDAMRAAMASAEVGDDVFGDDPTVNALEAYAAELLGKPAAVLVTSGTQSNLCALLAHCGRGDEYIVGENAHSFKYEAGGAAVLGSIQPQTVPMLDDGTLDLDRVRAAVKPDDSHFARTKLLCLENTHDGKVQTVAQMHEAGDVARAHGLAMHLDGARLWNAAAALEADPAELAEPFDSVSVCLSKGLGAPVGSILVGSQDVVTEARKWRKMLGGGLRQAGIIAAAGRHALEHHRERLVDDHANAQALAAGLSDMPGVSIKAQNTNMVFASLPVDDDQAFMQTMLDSGVRMLVGNGRTRMVTHLGVTSSDVNTVIELTSAALATS